MTYEPPIPPGQNVSPPNVPAPASGPPAGGAAPPPQYATPYSGPPAADAVGPVGYAPPPHSGPPAGDGAAPPQFGGFPPPPPAGHFAPPSYQAPPFEPGGSPVGPVSVGQRPAAATSVAVLFAVLALAELIMLGFRVVRSFHDEYFAIGLMIQNILVGLIVVALTLAAAALVVSGRDAGRSLGFAVSGYGTLANFSGFTFQAVFLVLGTGDSYGLAMMLGMLLLAGLSAAIFVMLLNRTLADWAAQQRSRR